MAAPDAAGDRTATADLTDRARARIAVDLVLKQLIENARSLIPTEADGDPAELITAIRLLIRGQGLIALEAAVVYAWVAGADWTRIAAALGEGIDEDLARRRYQERVRRWAAGEPVPPGPVLGDGAQPDGLPGQPDEIDLAVVAALEDWFLRTEDPQARRDRRDRPGRRPVMDWLR
jgi:hypothetical protein